jgi:hypothetical protein
LYKGFWSLSGAIYLLSVPIILLICFPKRCSNLQPGVTWAAVSAWFVASVSTVVVCEVTMATVFFVNDDYQLTSLETTEWTFGQVMAVVMLFFVVWDIAIYPFESSDEEMGTRFLHWWRTTFKPRHPAIAKFLALGNVRCRRFLILLRLCS